MKDQRQMQRSPVRDEQRAASLSGAKLEIEDLLAPMQARGFYGTVPLELELQDGSLRGPEDPSGGIMFE
jgi:hypothetical protein